MCVTQKPVFNLKNFVKSLKKHFESLDSRFAELHAKFYVSMLLEFVSHQYSHKAVLIKKPQNLLCKLNMFRQCNVRWHTDSADLRVMIIIVPHIFVKWYSHSKYSLPTFQYHLFPIPSHKLGLDVFLIVVDSD